MNDKNKIRNFENFLSFFNKKVRKIIKTEFNVEAPKVDKKIRFKRKFTTVQNPEIGNIFPKLNENSKFISNNKMIEVNINESCGNKLNFDNSCFDKNSIGNYLPSNSLLKRRVSILSSQKDLPEIKFSFKLNENENSHNLMKESMIDTKKLSEIQSYLEIEKKKMELLFVFYESFINIPIKDDYSNIFNGFDLINKNKTAISNNNTVLLTEITKENKNTNDLYFNIPKNLIPKKKKFPKYSENNYDFFDNIYKYKEINPEGKDKDDKCDLEEVIGCLGFNYNILLSKDARHQIAILDILFLSMVGVLKPTLTDKILFFIIKSKNMNKMDDHLISKNIRILLNMSKGICLGLIYHLIDKALNLLYYKTSENFMNDLEIRKIMRLSLSINNLESISTSFQINFNPEHSFDKRKTSILSFIKILDKDFKIFNELLLIHQHLYDFIIFMKIQDLLVQEDQFAFRVYLEFRNFLFEYQDKNTISTQSKIFRSLADKQLLEYSSRNLANTFYFWKPNLDNALDKDNNSSSNLNKNCNSARIADKLNETNIFDNEALKAKTRRIILNSSDYKKLALIEENQFESRKTILDEYEEKNNNDSLNINNYNLKEKTFYHNENLKRISVFSKIKSSNQDKTNISYTHDTKGNKNTKTFSFKTNLVSNPLDLSSDIKTIPDKETFKTNITSNLPIINKHEKTDFSMMKRMSGISIYDPYKQNKNKTNCSSRFYRNQSFNNPLLQKFKENDISRNYLYSSERISDKQKNENNTNPSLIKQIFGELTNNNNRINSESSHTLTNNISRKVIINGISSENTDINDHEDHYNSDKIKISNSNLKRKVKISQINLDNSRFSKSSNRFFIDKNAEINNELSNNILDYEKRNNKHKVLKNNYLSSLNLNRIDYPYYIYDNVSLKKIDEIHTIGSQINNPTIIDINNLNDMKNKEISSNNFMIRRNTIKNRNSMKIPINK